ncbi:MAG TPA: choice-of-anchor Q domain-containing protein, partial [Pyrinomonadaceae bacterium]
YINYDFAVARYNPDGSTDTTFGGGTGKVTTDMDELDFSYDVAIQSDGKIVVVGESGDYGGNYCNGFIIRYNPDGSLDTSFDVDGIVSTPTCDVTSVAIQPADGKIVVIGWGGYRYLIRYNSEDGSLDTSFGAGGIANTNMWSWGGHGLGTVDIQMDGKIMASVGYSVDGDLTTYSALVRYNYNGSPDTSFGTNGRANAPVFITDVAIESDGKIVAAGGNSGDFAVVRYNSNGSLDTGFGSAGIVTTPIFAGGEDGASSVAIQPNGKILASGYGHNGSNWDFVLVRYNPNGSLDSTFGGGDGISTVDFENGSNDSAYGLALDSQGRAVVVGESDGRFALARFLPDSSPATITVINTNDSGAGSLRQALVDATPGSTINFNPNVFSTRQTITLTSGQLVIDRNLTIQGPGANLLSISGNGSSRVLYINNGVTASLEGMTIRDGIIVPGGIGGGILNQGVLTVSKCSISRNISPEIFLLHGAGAGIYNDSSGTLTINDSTVSENKVSDSEGNSHGGGIANNQGTVTINNSTVSSNESHAGNGIFNSQGTLTINNSTIFGNTAFFGIGDTGGGIYTFQGTVMLRNTIVASNTGGDIGGGTVATASHNLIGDADSSSGIQNGVNGNIVGVNPLLGPLRNNGGPTMTHALRPASHAINAGNDCVLTANGCGDGSPAFATDQRGMPRNGAVDIGAFERQANDPAPDTPFDFDGDGKADPAVFRPSEGNWYMLGSQAGFMGVQWGLATDKPVPADYDADGKTDVAIFRDGVWWMLKSTGGYSATQWGLPGEKVVPADYDGDGKADQAIFRDGVWWILKSSGGYDVVQWGLPTDKLIPADYDGDGKTDQAIFRDGEWWIVFGSGGYTVINWGLAGDTPVPADYDGDGKADPAVYRDGIWWTLYSNSHTTNTWGIPGDVPVSMRAQ